ncbi:TonB-dependent receptor domain-containing protein [Alkalimonas mucilaginosa]|uniref:TonB-dependent receptor n=1 Tax=Alkalimonas mucilaginosa TaxID=3057676 RepID=A0ABU7JBT5_9GAMM|nr:TonB-dependent receptor [Alkalimonas sp. MEB004]MEE2023062.1 TonB-dependent receptor [Alkalimonas sp. MEB004]
MKTFRRSAVAALVVSAIHLPALAGVKMDLPEYDGEVIVVTAAGFEQKLIDAPASVTVVTREELAAKPFTSLADALRDIEGIDVGSGQDKNGNISITMRGLPSDYTLVLFNGRRQSDIGNIGPNNFGNSQFMYMPPLAAIERIEVVRGPMSTLYGADAIGGVINIITRRHMDSTHGSVTASYNLQQDSQYGDDKKLDLFLSGPSGLNGLVYQLRAGIYDRDDSDPSYQTALPLPDGSIWSEQGNFGDRKIVGAKNWNAGLTLNYALTEQQDLAIEYDISKQRYDNRLGQTGTLDGPESLWRASGGIVMPRVGYTPYQRVEREQFVLSHQGRFDFGNWQSALTKSRSENFGRSLPLTVEERLQVQAIWDQAREDQGVNVPALTDAIRLQLENEFLPRPLRTLKIDNLIIDTKLESQWQNHFFVVGAQYFNADMEDGVFGMYGDGYRAGTEAKHRQWAIFAEDSMDLTTDLTATLGARYDHHNIFGSQFSPRAYLNWRGLSNWTLKGGISTGYKTPRPEQLFSGITGFGGQGTSPMVGTPGLQPETSINYEVAAYYTGSDRFSGNITLFYNDFKDKIISQDNLPNCEVAAAGESCVDVGTGWADLGYVSFRQASNVDKSETRGVELAGKVKLSDSWSMTANYTFTDSEVKSGNNQGLPLVSTPRHMINANLSWQLTEPLSLSLISEIRSKRFRGTQIEPGPDGPETNKLYYKSYQLFHLSAMYRVSDAWVVSARINNLLDDDLSSRTCRLTEAQDAYSCTSDYNTSMKARSFWLSATYNF